MAKVIMPKMGDGMAEGKVISWYKRAGETVTQGEALLQIETDKVNVDIEAEESGTLTEILVPDGAVAPVGATLAVIGGDGAESLPGGLPVAPVGATLAVIGGDGAESLPGGLPVAPVGATLAVIVGDGGTATTTAKPAAKANVAVAPSAEPATAPGASAAAVTPAARPAPAAVADARAVSAAGGAERQRSSPLARAMARQQGLDLAAIPGSGPQGRVVARDVSEALGVRAGAPGPAFTDEPLSAMRRTIAKRLGESLGPIPHFYLTVEADMEEAEALRARLNQIEGIKVSVNDLIVRAAALALGEHPDVNASFTGDAIRRFAAAHVAIAVATPAGLTTPVVRDAGHKTLREIATETRRLAERARDRKLTPDEYSGSTFTISNLGMYGIDEFTAVINPPNAAILAVGAVAAKAVVVGEAVAVRRRLRLTLSCDHRVIDGAVGAQFLKRVRTLLEQPLSLLV